MTNLDKINFKKYLSSENNLNVCLTNPFNKTDLNCEKNSYDDDTEASCELLESDLEINKKVALDKELKKFESVSINNLVYKLEKISDTFMNFVNIINYQIHYVKNSDKIDQTFGGISSNNVFIVNVLEFLTKMLNLEFNKNSILKNNVLEYLKLEDIKFYLVPKIEINFDDIFTIYIRESDKFFKFKIRSNNIFTNEIISELQEIVDYFNSRYNTLSGIINHLRLRQKNYCIK